ncbi:MAG: glycosyl transferase family protein [Nitrosomonadales bacterium]|nr:glycosyl transferase family protein [Nitrosomonadales bacterium]
MTHPFAPYIQILGKGQRGSRDMTQQEAEQSMTMILNGQVEPTQLGAYLMLMRVKEETAAEMAGFAQASRQSLKVPQDFPPVDLDWASYAGKRRQLPWFILSALLLASHGSKVLMHGIGAQSADRVYTPDALAALGIASCDSFAQAAQQLQQRNFAFIPLDKMNPTLQYFIDLKETLGLRSPMHSVVRMLNPGHAPVSVMGIFHPGYDETHQSAAQLLGDNNLAVFKGEGGEAERNPDTECKVRLLLRGEMLTETWPALFGSRHMKDEKMDVSRLAALWRGEIEDEYGQAAVLSTAAIALRAMGRAASIDEAERQAADYWQRRDRHYICENLT